MISVLTALGNRFEAQVATVLGGSREVNVVRRCADLAELVAAAESGVGRAALVSDDLRSLDLGIVERLRAAGVRLVGIADDEAGERRLRQIGIDHVVSAGANVGEFDAVILTALSGGRAGAPGAGTDLLEADDDLSGSPSRTGPVPAPPKPGLAAGSGDGPAPQTPNESVMVAVWGPIGSPGRTTVAINLAAEAAALGVSTLLVDADTYAASTAQLLALLDEAPGLASACRVADQGHLDVAGLARVAPRVDPGFRVLTGLPQAERWPELREAALAKVLDLTRGLADLVVVDVGFCLEDDEELSYDTLAPRRNAAALTVLDRCDAVVAVGVADPIGLSRLVRGLQLLAEKCAHSPILVVNRVRASSVGSSPKQRIDEALARFAGVGVDAFLPDEPDALDACVLTGRVLAEAAPDSGIRAPLAQLAARLSPGTEEAGVARSRARRSLRVRRRSTTTVPTPDATT